VEHERQEPAIATVARALPPHYAAQETLVAAFRELWGRQHFNVERLEQLHHAVGVGGRHLALPIDDYRQIRSFAAANDAWTRVALDLGEAACREALQRAGVGAAQVGHIFFVTVTGLATPSIDARLVNRLGLRADVKRTPIFGLGCVAGAAGLGRAADYLRAFPDEHALLLSVELCSLTLQRDDLSIANVIASGLFGDGAAAVLLRGGACAGDGPRIVATRSVFYRDTEYVMGWDLVDGGFKVVLAADVPDIVARHLGHDVDAFLRDHDVARHQLRHVIAHTGGPKVLAACERALSLPPGALERSWASLRSVGNLSSASVLFVLGDTLDARVARPGDLGLVVAMGPGFCAELVLLRW
jgi:alkylresorcinol/alkylpyrone synthase